MQRKTALFLTVLVLLVVVVLAVYLYVAFSAGSMPATGGGDTL